MRHLNRVNLPLIALLLATAANADDVRLIRSFSGPSGKVDGAKFVFDETRNRFVYPRDKSLVVYFEFEAPAATHSLTAVWKGPAGLVSAISPDVKIESHNHELNCYWTYILGDGVASGVWTVEIRVDGQPAGSHSFEIVAPAAPKPVAVRAVEKPPSLDEIFRVASRSVVWVRKLDGQGRQTDTSMGFVTGKNRIMTAFQAVDSATKLEVEFATGRKVVTDALLAWSRNGDWAVVTADTADTPALPAGDPKVIVVGSRLVAFTIEGGARVIGGVDIAGRGVVPGFGGRIQITPSLVSEAAGGPLLDLWGKTVGIMGGSLVPGARSGTRIVTMGAGLGTGLFYNNAAVPMPVVPEDPTPQASNLQHLAATGILTAPIREMPEFIYGVTARDVPKRAADPVPHETAKFSRRDPDVWVFTLWMQKGKLSKGILSGRVYDDQNRLRVKSTPRKTSLYSTPLRSAFSFSPEPLTPGIYRIDVIWDEEVAWRTFIRITE